ncbi:MAG: NAD(P)/FAD-dependent oxidoreductase [Anaerolineae bacterium]
MSHSISNENSARRIAVIGAGIAGLAAANDLTKAGYRVTVYEAAPQAGGLASGFRDPSWEWPLERFYHHIFQTDRAILDLAKEIGYADRTFFRAPVTAQWWQGKGYALDGPLPVMRFPALPVADRARFGAAIAYLKYGVRDWQPLEGTTAAAWTRQAMGETVYQTLIHPLLEGKFGPYADEVNMAWLWARFKTRSFKLGYFVGGFQGFTDALLAYVRRAGVAVTLGTPIQALNPLPDGRWQVVAPATDAAAPGATYDGVVVTGSPGLLNRLVPALPLEYLGKLKTLRSMGAVVMTIALRKPLTGGLYWVNMPKDQFPFLALVEHTSFIEPARYGGDHLIYCGDYLDPSHEYFRLSQDELLGRFLPALKQVNPAFDESWVRAAWLHREPYAQPIVTVNHSRNIPPLKTPLPGLFWASMSQVYPWDRGTNFAVEIGQRVARTVAAAGAVPAPAQVLAV